jgi:hypothetical protein
LDGVAHDWCRSLSVSTINSLKSFHTPFHSFYEDKFLADFLYPECCHQFYLLYKGSYNHERSSYVEENVKVEEIVHDNQDVECLPTIFSDYYGFEDHFSFSQRALEISEGNLQQLSNLQIEGISNTHEELNLQRPFTFNMEQQEDCKYDCDISFEYSVVVLLESYFSYSLIFSYFIISLALVGENDFLKEFL